MQFTQRCRIQFATTATGPQVPWTILYFDFCGMFPESSFAGQKYPTLHRAIWAFRSLFTRALKVSGLNTILSPNCTHLKPFGLGKVANLFGAFKPNFWRSLLVWFSHFRFGRGFFSQDSPQISLTGFTLCNSNSQMHRLALSYPWVMGVNAAAKKATCSNFISCPAWECRHGSAKGPNNMCPGMARTSYSNPVWCHEKWQTHLIIMISINIS